jgi:outer membrane protein OmpA-like peptidoglycan-associated protein
MKGTQFFFPLLVVLLGLVACGPSQQEVMAKEQLDRARGAYSQIQADPDVKAYAPAPLADAGKALKAAEEAKSAEEMMQLASFAEKKAQAATAVAQAKAAEQAAEKLEHQSAEALFQQRELEQKMARKEAEKSAQAQAEAQQARLAAQAEAEKVSQLKAEAELARQTAQAETEKALQLKAEAEKALSASQLEAEKAAQLKAEAEKARIASQEEAQKAEQLRKDAEKKLSASQEEVQKAVQIKDEAEKTRLAAEASVAAAAATAAALAEAGAEVDQLLKEFPVLKAVRTERGIVLTVDDAWFESGKADLSSEADLRAGKMAGLLNRYPNRPFLVEGHTDNVGTDAVNLALSQRRADVVKEKLVAAGVAADRMTTIGYGAKFPKASNNTAAGRQQNRRVEIVILDKGANPMSQIRK